LDEWKQRECWVETFFQLKELKEIEEIAGGVIG